MPRGRKAVLILSGILTAFAVFLLCVEMSLPVPRGGEVSGRLMARLISFIVLSWMTILTDIAVGTAALVGLLLPLGCLKSPVRWERVTAFVLTLIDGTCILLAIGHAVYVIFELI